MVLLALLAGLITPTSCANGTTLPFQRHVVELQVVERGVVVQRPLFAAVQKQGSDREGLVLFVSTDGGASWRRDQPVQGDPAIRDTADLLPDANGQGFSLVYSVEPVSSRFGPAPGSKVVYLHYRLLPDRRIGADLGPVTVFQPGDGQGFFRASLTRDSRGLYHCGATYFNGTDYRYLVRTSTDGVSWSHPAELAWFAGTFGGGRVIAYGARVAAILDEYSVSAPGRLATRPAGPEGTWSAPQPFAPEGIYHAGAFSVVATPDGHLHLGYSEKSYQQLRYREFDGTRWSAPVNIEQTGIWSNQPALSHSGNSVSYAWNHFQSRDTMQILQRTRGADGVWSASRTVAGNAGFKGYTSAIEEVPAGSAVQILWSEQPNLGPAAASIVSESAPLP